MKDLVLREQYNYYAKHESDLLSAYAGMHLVIGNKMQVNAFRNPKSAYSFGVEHYGAGHFLLHKCVPGSLNVVHCVNSFAM